MARRNFLQLKACFSRHSIVIGSRASGARGNLHQTRSVTKILANAHQHFSLLGVGSRIHSQSKSGNRRNGFDSCQLRHDSGLDTLAVRFGVNRKGRSGVHDSLVQHGPIRELCSKPSVTDLCYLPNLALNPIQNGRMAECSNFDSGIHRTMAVMSANVGPHALYRRVEKGPVLLE